MGAIMWWHYYSARIYIHAQYKWEYVLQNYNDYNKRRIQVRWVNMYLRAITFHPIYSDQKQMRTLMSDDDGNNSNNTYRKLINDSR